MVDGTASRCSCARSVIAIQFPHRLPPLGAAHWLARHRVQHPQRHLLGSAQPCPINRAARPCRAATLQNHMDANPQAEPRLPSIGYGPIHDRAGTSRGLWVLWRVVQSQAPPLGARLPQPATVRGATHPAAGQRCRLTVSGPRGPTPPGYQFWSRAELVESYGRKLVTA
jgi:hypothetical protein